jgi:hypothetical protein
MKNREPKIDATSLLQKIMEDLLDHKQSAWSFGHASGIDGSFALVAKDLEKRTLNLFTIVEPGSDEELELRATLKEFATNLERLRETENAQTRAIWVGLLEQISKTVSSRIHTESFYETTKRFFETEIFSLAVKVATDSADADPGIFASRVLALAEKNKKRVDGKNKPTSKTNPVAQPRHTDRGPSLSFAF